MCTVNGFGRHRARPGAAPFGHEQQEPDTSQWRTCEIAYLENRKHSFHNFASGKLVFSYTGTSAYYINSPQIRPNFVSHLTWSRF